MSDMKYRIMKTLQTSRARGTYSGWSIIRDGRRLLTVSSFGECVEIICNAYKYGFSLG